MIYAHCVLFQISVPCKTAITCANIHLSAFYPWTECSLGVVQAWSPPSPTQLVNAGLGIWYLLLEGGRSRNGAECGKFLQPPLPLAQNFHRPLIRYKYFFIGLSSDFVNFGRPPCFRPAPPRVINGTSLRRHISQNSQVTLDYCFLFPEILQKRCVDNIG